MELGKAGEKGFPWMQALDLVFRALLDKFFIPFFAMMLPDPGVRMMTDSPRTDKLANFQEQG
jgi:hypothetical protein